MRQAIPAGAPIVIKVGSSSVALPDGGLDEAGVQRVVEQTEGLWQGGNPAVLVTSGAVAAGISAMGLTARPTDLPGLQVAAAVGQSRLMERYGREFGERGRIVGQMLITRDVLAERGQYLHAREAFERMLDLGVVPVVNENDTVVVDELKFGDNDRLAAIVSHLVGAALLVILTDTAGLYSADPHLDDGARLLSAVRHTDAILDELYRTRTAGALGSGGVATKIAAARMAAWSGIPTVIAAAGAVDAPVRAVAGEDVGTWIAPQSTGLSARKLWIAFGLPARGTVRVDDGAVTAVTTRGGSLLAVGVVAVEGTFSAGDAVEIRSVDGAFIGKGLAGMGADRIGDVVGRHTSEIGGPVVHRDDLVVLI